MQTAESSVQTPRVANLLAGELDEPLDEHGFAMLPALLSDTECEQVAALYASDDLFRKRVTMARHGFGRGEYKYFRYPLPPFVADLRAALYERLQPVANRWNAALGADARYPSSYQAFTDTCHAAGQTQPTPLLLHYTQGDYNCLHQDLYGELSFPLQVAVLLSAPERDFTGGEFVVTEQRPRAQSRPSVVPLRQGDAVVFAVAKRPVRGPRGYRRVTLRHGVSQVRSGQRRALGIIFHDAP